MERKRLRKRGLSLLLVTAMALTGMQSGPVWGALTVQAADTVKTVALNTNNAELTATITTVTTLEELQSALEDSSITEVVVENAIDLPEGTTIEGNGKVIRVEKPYVSEDGENVTSDYSNYNVFNVTGGQVVIKNASIYGGYINDLSAGGIVVEYGACLTLEDVTIARCGRGIYNSGTLILKNSNIVRNVCGFGGGFVNAGGKVIMDGCSLSKNRSTESNGGGGACENKRSGVMYINNTTIANNCSSEIGGAINNYNANTYIMNSTICGNVTTREAAYGGGIGYNGGTVYAVNCILTHNESIDKYNNNTHTASDIGIYGGNGVHLYHCIYGAISGDGDNAYDVTDSRQLSPEEQQKLYKNFSTDGIFIGTSGITEGFTHPALIRKGGEIYALYAAPAGDSAAVRSQQSSFVTTYFNYDDVTDIKMSYKAGDGAEIPLGGLATGGTEVTSYYAKNDGRNGSMIGASDSDDRDYYTVKLQGLENGRVKGVSFEDAYLAGTEITVTAVADPGYVFWMWQDETGARLSKDNPYTFRINKDITLKPIFKQHVHSWVYQAGTGDTANKITATCESGICEAVPTTLNLTLCAGTLTYSGSAQGVSYKEGEADAWKAELVTDVPTIVYYTDEELSTPTDSANSGAAGQGMAPVNAGTYYATATVEDETAKLKFVIEKAGQEAPSSGDMTVTNETVAEKKDGKISGVNNTMEYSVDGQTVWNKVNGTEITDLAPGEVAIRKAETGNYYASEPIYLLVEAGDVKTTGSDSETGVGTGKILTETDISEGAPKVTVEAIEEDTAEILFNDDERTSVKENGATGIFYLTVDNIDKIVSDTDKNIVRTQLDEIAADIVEENADGNRADDVKTGVTYLDVNLFLKVGDGESRKIKNTEGKPVKVTITIPEVLLPTAGHERVYKVIRIHEDGGDTQIDVLDGVFDKATGTFTFSTDRFSTYALVYAEKVSVAQPSDNNNSGSNGNTGNSSNAGDAGITDNSDNEDSENPIRNTVPATEDSNSLNLWITMLIVSFSTLVAITCKRKSIE